MIISMIANPVYIPRLCLNDVGFNRALHQTAPWATPIAQRVQESSLHIFFVLEPHPFYEDLGSDCGSQRVPLQRYNLHVTS